MTQISQPQNAPEQVEPAIISLPAELDLDAERAAAADLLAAVAAGRPVVLADLTGTTFVDSAGARLLYRAHRDGARRGVEVRFVISRGSVLRTLEIMGYTKVLAIYPSRAAALASRPVPSA